MKRHCSVCHQTGHDARRHRNPFGFGKKESPMRRAMRKRRGQVFITFRGGTRVGPFESAAEARTYKRFHFIATRGGRLVRL